MINLLKESLWNQFGASIDMLDNAVAACPDELLHTNKKFFYVTFHTLMLLDYYLTIPPKDFTAALPFTITGRNEIPEEAIDDMIPDRFYTKKELLDYLQATRKKCFTLISNLTEEKLHDRFGEEGLSDAMDYSILEILLYNMRHVQHHAAQLNLFLRQAINTAPKWVFQAK